MKASIIYFSESGTTEKAAQYISNGINEIEGMETRLFNIKHETSIDVEFVNESVLAVFGTPTYCTNMCWQLKKWFDTRNGGCNLSGKLGAVFATENSPHGGGAELALITMAGHMMANGMLIYSGGAVGNMPKIHIGPTIVRDELEKREELCKVFGHRIAQKAHELF